MRRLILSDIHANLEALEAVLRDAAGRYDEILCCGDVVGYNASPGEVVDWARAHVAHIVRGNHDRVCSHPDEWNDFNSIAWAAAVWTHGRLGPDQLAWLRALPRGPLYLDDCQLVHGSPEDEDEYLVSRFDILPMHNFLQRKICFFGHTHLQGGWMWTRGGLAELEPPRRTEAERVYELDDDGLYMINPGSVGQPRDRDPRAAYALWDVARRTIAFRRVPYDVEGAQSRILSAGLPENLAHRLALGR